MIGNLNILIIDDEKNICLTLKDILSDWGCKVQIAFSGEMGLKKCNTNQFDIIFLDVNLPGIDGIETFKQIKEVQNTVEILMISGQVGIDIAVKAIKMGAYDFIEKPISIARIETIFKNILEKNKLVSKLNNYSQDEIDKYQMIGNSIQFQNILKLIDKIAPTNSKILIQGESGTGKELIARRIHRKSLRASKSFIAFNSAAIPENLVESELFGYEKGAFTGAEKQKMGKIELASNGTLFLDEIGDMNLQAQSKLLRFIQEGTFERLGGKKTLEIDIRIIAATHKNLLSLIENGKFREDLYYRLNVIPIEIPPLRTRSEDLNELVPYFMEKISIELNLSKKNISKSGLKILKSYNFPGNVRELRNLIERLYLLNTNNDITENDLQPLINRIMSSNKFINEIYEIENLIDAKKEFERKYLIRHLKLNNWNLTKTALQIGIHQPNLSRKIKELNIKKE